jgi:hypothetical protein
MINRGKTADEKEYQKVREKYQFPPNEGHENSDQ